MHINVKRLNNVKKMTKISGQTSKLISIQDNPVSYYLSINDEKIHLNPYLNKKIKRCRQYHAHRLRQNRV